MKYALQIVGVVGIVAGLNGFFAGDMLLGGLTILAGIYLVSQGRKK